MLTDQIQTNMADDRLLLCVHGYDIRSRMKPSFVGEIFIVLKIFVGVLYFWDTLYIFSKGKMADFKTPKGFNRLHGISKYVKKHEIKTSCGFMRLHAISTDFEDFTRLHD